MCSVFLSYFFLEGMAFIQTAAHAHLLGLPVDLWVMFSEPGKAHDDVLLSQPCDCKGGLCQDWSLGGVAPRKIRIWGLG